MEADLVRNEVVPGEPEASSVFPVQIKSYKRRWWILFLFAGTGFMQCAVWNTWGPITKSAKAAYPSWTDAQIGIFSMWGTITMIIGLVPVTYMLQTKGLRAVMLLSTGLLALATGIRLFATGQESFTIFAHIGAILNGFAGIAIGIAPSLLSSTWFPTHERTTATGIGCTFNQLGNSGGFFIGPWLVREPHSSNSSNFTSAITVSGAIDIETELIRRSIRDYMWLTAAVCIPFFLCTLAYFPSKPKRPPSLTSAMHLSANTLREDLALILRNKNLLLLLIPYSLTLGVNVAWSSVLDINLAPLAITQKEASWIGVYMSLGGVGLAILSSKFTDWLYGYIKVTLICFLLISTVMFTWLLFLSNGCLHPDKTQIFISSILGSSFGYACSPLFFELAVEIAFPVSEGVVGGILCLFWNITAAVYLAIMQIGFQNVVWMNYLLAIQCMISLLILLIVREQYKRNSLDNRENVTVKAEDDDHINFLSELFRSGDFG